MFYKRKPITDILRSPKTVITFKDVSLIWGDTDRQAAIAGVNYYVKTGQLYRIRRGIYAKDKKYNYQELATRIFTPSYVSFETVLTQAGINFQYYDKIFAASYLTREIIIDDQTYVYKKLKDYVLADPSGILHINETSIASAERAVLDTLYINKDYHFDNLRPLNWEKVFELLPLYKNKRLEKKIQEYYNNFKSLQITHI